MPLVRCLTQSGIDEFREYLNVLKNSDATARAPTWLLDDPRHSRPLDLTDIQVELREFGSRLEFARYFSVQVAEAGYEGPLDRPGLWEWLTLFYFELVCPSTANGSRTVGHVQRYIPPIRVHSHYLHLLKGAYDTYLELVNLRGSDYELILSGPVSKHGSAFDHLVSRPRLRTSPGVQLAARRLYFDEQTGEPKSRFSVGPTRLGEFAKHLRNLPPEYQLDSMSAESVLSLLPSEFLAWLDENHRDEVTSNRGLFGLADPTTMSDPSAIAEILTSLESRGLTRSQRRMRSDRFRTGVIRAYGSSCAISGIGLAHIEARGSVRDVRYEVEAAHIIPVAHGGNDVVPNGLALSRTLHWAFDNGMIWVNGDLRVQVASEVHRDNRNEWLQQFEGAPLQVPNGANLQPSADALRWHAEHVAGVKVG